jgi:RHS repeat-associated protein
LTPYGGRKAPQPIGTDWGGERLVDWTTGGANQRFYGTNGHPDVTWTADGAGAVSATLRYDPWGTITSSTGSSTPHFRFQGSLYDSAVDLSWAVTRWYAPTLGRFISEDSLLGTPNDPPSRHLYTYAQGDRSMVGIRMGPASTSCDPTNGSTA